MRRLAQRVAVLTTSLAVALTATAGTAQAVPTRPAPVPQARFTAPGVLNDQTTPVARGSATSERDISVNEFAADRGAAGRPLTASQLAVMASAYCRSYTASQWETNIYGGTLYRLDGTVSWCYDYSIVWSGSWKWTYSTGFGWYFDHWTNPANGYYVPGDTEYHTVAQAKFCITWCAGSDYLGQNVWGKYDGSGHWTPL